MNKKLFLLLTGSAIAFFFACSGDVLESGSKANLALTVTVQDIVTGELLDAADMSLNGGKSKQAKGGTIVLKDLATGSHTLKVKKEGYAEVSVIANLEPTLGQAPDLSRSYNEVVALRPLTSSAYGYLFYEDEDGITRPAADIDVNLKLYDIMDDNDEFVKERFAKSLYTTKTDADGKYSFEELPFARASIRVPATTIGNINFAFHSRNTQLLPEGAVLVNPITLDKTDNLFVVTDYPKIIQFADIAKTIKFKFTEAVDKSWKDTYIGAYDENDDDVIYSASWNGDNTELILTPMGNWRKLTYIDLELKSISGRTTYEYFPITVLLEDLSAKPAIAPVLLSDTALNKVNNSYTVYFKYDKIPGATNYVVYTNENDGIYQYANPSPLQESETDKAQYLSFSSIKREIGILVQAVNNNSRTPLDESKAIKIKDVVRPTCDIYGCPKVTTTADALYSEDARISFPSTATATPYTQNVTVSFSENVQVENITHEVVNGHANMKVERIYNSSPSSVTYRVTTTGPAPAAGTVKADLVLKGIKDLSGNKYEVKYVTGADADLGTSEDATIRLYN